MKIQEALDTIDEMITKISQGQMLEYNYSNCSDRSFYEEMDARHALEIEKYEALREAIERGLEY